MKKQFITEAARMQKLAGIIKENNNAPSDKDQIDAILSVDKNSELEPFIKPVKFMLDQAFAEDVDASTIEEEATQEMDFQLERASDLQIEGYKDLRLIFAKVKAILMNMEPFNK